MEAIKPDYEEIKKLTQNEVSYKCEICGMIRTKAEL